MSNSLIKFSFFIYKTYYYQQIIRPSEFPVVIFILIKVRTTEIKNNYKKIYSKIFITIITFAGVF
jgi:hypothetical protein